VSQGRKTGSRLIVRQIPRDDQTPNREAGIPGNSKAFSPDGLQGLRRSSGTSKKKNPESPYFRDGTRYPEKSVFLHREGMPKKIPRHETEWGVRPSFLYDCPPPTTFLCLMGSDAQSAGTACPRERLAAKRLHFSRAYPKR